jgi:transposase
VEQLLDLWISQAQHSRLAPFVKAAKTIRKQRDRILAAIRLGISNDRSCPSTGVNDDGRRFLS